MLLSTSKPIDRTKLKLVHRQVLPATRLHAFRCRGQRGQCRAGGNRATPRKTGAAENPIWKP